MGNLLKEIFDRIEFERLIEEGRDPSEVLHHKYDETIPSDIIDAVMSVDPTKKKSYSQWALGKYSEEPSAIRESLKNGKLKRLFDYFKSHQEIQLKAMPSVEGAIRDYVPDFPVWHKSKEPMTYVMNLKQEVPSEKANDFDIVYNDGSWIIAVPNTYEAECKLGENMKWCTANAYGNGLYYYNDYLRKGGKYYVNFDLSHGESRNGKDYPYTRYQFHFETDQLMDLYDDPVDALSIGMPEGAFAFYESEGYGEEYFENDEAKRKKYEEQRDRYSFKLDDGLYLKPEYDHDYIFNEPDKDTPFYIYTDDDTYDPIIHSPIPNPHEYDPIVENYVGLIILENAHLKDRYVAVSHGTLISPTKVERRTSRSWFAKNIRTDYILSQKDYVIFAIKPGDKGAYFSSNKSDVVCAFGLEGGFDTVSIDFGQDGLKMFLNPKCTEADQQHRTFLEIVSPDNYHSLVTFNIEYGFREIVKKDIPVNEIYYTINDRNFVEGEFRNYMVLNKEFYGDEADNEKYDWHLVKKLNDGRYLIQKDKGQKNIYIPDENRLLSYVWFDSIRDETEHAYILNVRTGINIIISRNGMAIFGAFTEIRQIDGDEEVFGGFHEGSEIEFEIVNLKTWKSRQVNNIYWASTGNQKVVVRINGELKIYDYVQDKICFPELKNLSFIGTSLLFCDVEGKHGSSIFDFDKLQIISDNISRLGNRIASDDLFIVIKNNGRKNVIDTIKHKEALPNDVGEIIMAGGAPRYIVYISNGKYFVWESARDKLLTNPNGTRYKPSMLLNDGVEFECENFDLKLKCSPEPIPFIFGDNGYERINNSNATPEVMEAVRDILGGQPQNNGINNVRENFRNTLKRITETIR